MRHIPEAGAVCGNSARTDLCGGRGVTSVPTATRPAPGRATHASKARHVLKQHQHRLVADLSVVLYCLGNRPGKVFLNNS